MFGWLKSNGAAARRADEAMALVDHALTLIETHKKRIELLEVMIKDVESKLRSEMSIAHKVMNEAINMQNKEIACMYDLKRVNATPDPSQSLEHKDIWKEIEKMWGAIDAILDHLHMDLEMAPTLKERKGE